MEKGDLLVAAETLRSSDQVKVGCDGFRPLPRSGSPSYPAGEGRGGADYYLIFREIRIRWRRLQVTLMCLELGEFWERRLFFSLSAGKRDSEIPACVSAHDRRNEGRAGDFLGGTKRKNNKKFKSLCHSKFTHSSTY